jgi:hypothetical protein
MMGLNPIIPMGYCFASRFSLPGGKNGAEGLY